MKKLFFVLLGLTLFTGCDNRTEEERYHDYLEKQKQEKINKAHEERWHGFNVIVIDSCEYLYKKYEVRGGYAGYGYGFMAHKGNCKFCAERNKNK